MLILYNIGIRFYYLLIILASPFNIKAKQWIKGRKEIFTSLKEKIDDNDNIIWLHVSSLGEFEQGRPVIEKIKANKPKQKILLTFFSPSGYEIRKKYTGVDYVYYLPLDTKKNAKKFLEITKPTKIVFVKYEFWYHFLDQINKRNIPCYLISAVFRPNQIFFKSYGKWYRKTLRYFSHLFVQNDESKKLLNNIGITEISVSGDTRFDRVYEISKQSAEIPVVNAFKEKSKLIIAGSTWENDETHLCKFILNTSLEIKFIIAPHEIHVSHLNNIMKAFTNEAILFSKATEESVKNYKVLIIDNIGMLSSLYKYGNIAYIGGGFGKGIHNILEPAGFNLPIIFGPNYMKFQEAIDLVNINGAISYTKYDELEKIISELLNNSDLLSERSKLVHDYFHSKLGATDQIINKFFNKESSLFK